MIFNDATISRLSSSISNEPSLGNLPPLQVVDGWANSSSSINERLTFRFFKTFSPILVTFWPPTVVPPLWPANYRHGSRARCVFLKRRYVAKRNTNLYRLLPVRFPLSPHLGDGVALVERNGVSQRSISTRCNFKARLAVMRAFWFRDQPWRVSREI